MAEFACPSCNHLQTVPEEHIGKKTKCPKCQQPGVVQATANMVAPDSIGPEKIGSPNVLRKSGGSIQTVLSRTIRLNEESSLKREFITIIHNTLPACLNDCIGITTVYESETDYTSAGFMYATQFAVSAREDLHAFETRFLLFNIWGRHVQTLTATEIADVPASSLRECVCKWELYSENEATEHYASIAYLATVRTAAGRVIDAEIEPVLAEAKRLFSKFTDADLEPTPLRR